MWRIILFAASAFSVAKSLEYGLDMAFPHTDPEKVSTNYPWLPHNIDPENNPVVPDEHVNKTLQILGDRRKVYEDYIQGCRDYWENKWGNDGRGTQACNNFERDRFKQSISQPISMVNFTDIGYKKIKTPEHVFKMITDFWEANKDNESDEQWHGGNSFVNYWENPSKMVSVEDTNLVGGGRELHDAIWDVTKDLISAWTGQELEGSSVYGIRIYKEGAILAPHVDRLPLISSAIINVEQDVDEEWPLEVFGHDGVARNVTMEPGDMVLYESHSVLHGRPFALKGRYFANIFIHFMPVPSQEQLNDHELPPYIREGSSEAKDWFAGRFDGQIPGAPKRVRKVPDPSAEPNNNSLRQHESHFAAQKGNLTELVRISNEEKEALFAKDRNGWEPIHEAVRGGNKEAIQFLVLHGADINSITNFGTGTSALELAVDHHDNDFVEWLKSLVVSEDNDDDMNTMKSEL